MKQKAPSLKPDKLYAWAWKVAAAWMCYSLSATLLPAQKKLPDPASFFPAQKTKVLLVGSFHFDYPGLDAHVTAQEDRVDVLSPSRQKEMQQLVAYIQRFKPTKVALEATPEWRATAKLRDYKAGKLTLGRDERHQIGLKLAAEGNLDTIYSVDARNLAQDLEVRDPKLVDSLFQDYDFESSDTMVACSKRWFTVEDSMMKKVRLLDYFKHINSVQSHRYDYGTYLIGDFRLGAHRGADVLSIWWYNRNLRIFRKIQDFAEPGDRIVVLIGNGHAAVLRQFFECSPEFELVEFGKL
jgi:hypothetical protein